MKRMMLLCCLVACRVGAEPVETNHMPIVWARSVAWSAETNTCYIMIATNVMLVDPVRTVDNLERWESVENVVKLLAERGHICKVYGHNWRDGRPGEGDGFVFADWHPNTQYRTCRICGKCESLTMEWK